MPTPFDTMSMPDVLKLLSARTTSWYQTNRRLYAGDHWLDGTGWFGPQPAATDAASRDVLVEIKRGFVSSNKIKETVDRHTNGVLGREPAWSLTVRRGLDEGEVPSADEQTLIDEAEAALTAWWDVRGPHQDLQQAMVATLLAGRSSLRVYVLPGELDADGRVPAGDMQEQLARIYLDTADPSQATVHSDRATKQSLGIDVEQDGEATRIELCYRDGAETVLRILRSDATTIDETRLQLGGRLTMYEVVRPHLVTDQVRQAQALLNLALTMLQRNVVLGGFLERVILNAQLPGSYVDDTTVPGGKRFVPAPMKVGAASLNALAGIPIEDEEGNVRGYTSPSVVYKDPVAVQTFEDTRRIAALTIYEETHQLHTAISGDAVTSGESRRQAMADFVTDLRLSASRIEAAGRWLLETVLAMAAHFAGTPGRYEGLRAVFDCRVDPGPLSADELRIIMDLYNADLRSRETAMSATGVDDVDAEQTRILTEREQELQPVTGATA
jgi:hypothetical protein